jgi:hypothetical protein
MGTSYQPVQRVASPKLFNGYERKLELNTDIKGRLLNFISAPFRYTTKKLHTFISNHINVLKRDINYTKMFMFIESKEAN